MGLSSEEVTKQLEALSEQKKLRPIVLWFSSGDDTDKPFGNAEKAIAHLREASSVKQNSVGTWDIQHSHDLGNSLGSFQGQNETLLDTNLYTGVRAAVAALSKGEITCESGVCIVLSKTTKAYYLLCRSDVKDATYKKYGIQ